ncbi:hypothetical protein [Hydrogenophaga sp. BPS33]|uniref:hypothetical protein n=1 Tax=Hydrogenophaga sp. BPS33 TaxID=2651974 RepID=UPI00131F71E0|nr:hypothetical protein [Hydrogenophaga sp. BPS33]QHE87260.1 hypothetical protein F9K07_21340 [Hydrogenophaga sp. BPS33]
MNHQDHRNRQQGGSQQEAYSQPSRQQGGSESPRQQQGDYGNHYRDRGHPTGVSGDWRREQDYRGGYQDDQSSQNWRSRSEQDRYGYRQASGQREWDEPHTRGGSYGGGQPSQWSDYGDQDREYGRREYGQYGLRDPGRSPFERAGGLDRDYRGAGYAGPGGYGGGYGGQDYGGQDRGRYGGGQQHQQFDPDYDQWRREQVRALDEDYNQWREDRFKKFSDEFSTWRNNRGQRTGASGKTEAGSTPGKSNKDNS